jgi:formylglycine-generating enzyme required for sulfatase activity
VTWYDAAEYCNWLSAQDGIPESEWCYLPNDDKKYADGMRLASNYLERRGYRLPSEAEWEFACRAGSVTSRYYGETEELLSQYTCYTRNSRDRELFPVGTLKPNDYGLFDMLGNVSEWSEDRSPERIPGLSPLQEDSEQDPVIFDRIYRLLHSGAFYYAPYNMRCATRGRNTPTTKTNYIGFRPARTVR